MRDIVRWGVVIGLVSAGVAWLGESLSSSKGVSLFPDLLSLIALVAVATVGFRRILHGAMSWSAVARTATALGATAGVIISVAALARGIARWNSPGVTFGAVALFTSFITIVVVMNLIAVMTFYGRRRATRIGV